MSSTHGSAAFSEEVEATPLMAECSPEELGELLQAFRPYLLAIANSSIPQSLSPKLGPSDLVQLTLAKGYGEYQSFRGATRSELAQWLRRILLNYLNQE